MGIFDDKQYDEMDWLTRAIEPTISKVNDVLSSIPEEMEVDHKILFNAIKESWGDINFSTIILETIQESTYPFNDLLSQDKTNIAECFTLHVPEGIFVDMEKEVITGPKLKITKHKSMFEEEELVGFMGREGLKALIAIAPTKDLTIERCNEVAELLGCTEALSKRSVNQKYELIYKSVHSHIRENKWNIKNVELSNKVCFWIKNYLVDGNLPSLTNFCKFKVMTHNGDAIYSIEEELV